LDTLPDKVHLVGSIGLDSVQDVFRTVGKAFGKRLKRIPDGEPGPRRLWVSFKYPLLRSSPFLRPSRSSVWRRASSRQKSGLANSATRGKHAPPTKISARHATRGRFRRVSAFRCVSRLPWV
jgi:hypothetical protein